MNDELAVKRSPCNFPPEKVTIFNSFNLFQLMSLTAKVVAVKSPSHLNQTKTGSLG